MKNSAPFLFFGMTMLAIGLSCCTSPNPEKSDAAGCGKADSTAIIVDSDTTSSQLNEWVLPPESAEQVSLVMRNYPRDMVPYTAMWIYAIQDSIKQKTDSIDETLYTEPPIYPTHIKFHFFKGLGIGAIIGFLICFIITRFI